MSYTQGFSLMKKASEDYNWDLNLAQIASIWRAGCIIRSVFLDRIKDAYTYNPKLDILINDLFFINEINKSLDSWKQLINISLTNDISIPSHSGALNYFFGITSESLPTNLIQAQRDYFGAHMFERVDSLRGEFFHNDWT